jgi:hypothetical protein
LVNSCHRVNCCETRYSSLHLRSTGVNTTAHRYTGGSSSRDVRAGISSGPRVRSSFGTVFSLPGRRSCHALIYTAFEERSTRQ